MDFKGIMIAGMLAMGVIKAQEESFIEEVIVTNKKKKLSSKQKKEKIAEELKELARDINQEMHELLRSQELVIDRLDELVNNDKNGIFSGASDTFLEKSVTEIEAYRNKATKRRKQQKEQNQFLKHGSAQ